MRIFSLLGALAMALIIALFKIDFFYALPFIIAFATFSAVVMDEKES